MRKFIIAAAFFLIFSVRLGICSYAEAYSLAAGRTGAVLMEKNGDEKYPCGTLSKLMTVNIAAERISAGELSPEALLSASERAEAVGGAKIWLRAGDGISVTELLKAAVIGNANDACIVLAEEIAGSEEEFVKLMNAKTAELSMSGTRYVNCHGYRSDGDSTTANDTAKLLCALSEHEFLREMFLTRTENIRGDTVMLVTDNPAAQQYRGALGFKTGFREKRGGGRIWYSAEGARRGDETYFSAALEYADGESSAERAFSLIDKGFAEFDTVSLIHPDEMPSEVTVRNGVKRSVRISADDSGTAVTAAGGQSGITSRLALPEYVYAPVKKGDKVGEILYFYKGAPVYAADITAASSAEKKTFTGSLCKMLKNMCDFE